VSEKRWHPFGVRNTWAFISGGLRYAATTGYYLAAFQAEIRSLVSDFAFIKLTRYAVTSMLDLSPIKLE
jgi:hypothetical protein